MIGLDTSSSIDAQTGRLFTAEVQSIVRRTGAEAYLLAFDVDVFTAARLDPNGWDGWQDRDWRTGGGTDFHDLFARTARLGPSIAVVLTDLDAPLPPRPTFPVLWAATRAVTPPPYGRLLVIGDQA